MKANELRIENIIGALRIDNPVMVTDITTSYGGVMIEADTFSERPIVDFYPIPITDEWLEKLGFEKKQFAYEIELGSYRTLDVFMENGLNIIQISFEPNEYEYTYIKLNTIQYVHELQNLFFAITGKELEVK